MAPKPKPETKTKQLIEDVAQFLAPGLSEKGFTYQPELESFVRDHGELVDRLRIDLVRGKQGGYQLAFDAGVRHPEVERLFWAFQPGRSPIKHSNTIRHYSVNVGPQKRAQFSISGSWFIGSDTTSFPQYQIKQFVHGYLMPWFDKYRDLKSIFNGLVALPNPDHQTFMEFHTALVCAFIMQDKEALAKVLKTRASARNKHEGFWQDFEPFYEHARAAHPDFFSPLLDDV